MNTNAGLLDLWTEPQERECLVCYVIRMRTDFGCDGTMRWTRHWRDLRAPAVAALDRTFRRHHTKCDCEVPFALGANSGEGHRVADHPTRVKAATTEPPVPCPGVRRGSTRPCAARGRPPPLEGVPSRPE